MLAWPLAAAGQDSVEFLNGAKLEGKILEIRKETREFDFESQIGQQKLTRTYPYSKVHAVILNGSRFELTPKSDAPNVESGERAESNKLPTRSKSEVLKLIEQAGTTAPDWFASTALDVPDSLELDWPLKAEGGWDNSRNVGQFIWDVVNPNERRWHAGIKLVHHCMTLHPQDKSLLDRDMDKLGTMYFTLLQDYARAAFWYQKVGVTANKQSGIHLAECYWRLGNKEMALAMMRGKALPPGAIKLLGDMGEIEDALKVTQVYSQTQVNNEAFLAAGDALRKAGRFDEAVAYYQRVLDSDTARNPEYEQRFNARAAGSIEAIQLFDQAEVSRVADGTYTDSSTGYNGLLELEATVTNGQLKSVKVTAHREKQFYAALTDTPQQIIVKQSVRGIDGTSGATITSQAIVHATAKALAQGSK